MTRMIDNSIEIMTALPHRKTPTSLLISSTFITTRLFSCLHIDNYFNKVIQNMCNSYLSGSLRCVTLIGGSSLAQPALGHNLADLSGRDLRLHIRAKRPELDWDFIQFIKMCHHPR